MFQLVAVGHRIPSCPGISFTDPGSRRNFFEVILEYPELAGPLSKSVTPT